MKTAMQQLIEWINSEDDLLEFSNRWNPIDDIVKKATELLEEEKRQIVEAAKNGYEHPMVLNGSDIKAEQYYNQTYNNENNTTRQST